MDQQSVSFKKKARQELHTWYSIKYPVIKLTYVNELNG